MKIVYVDMDNVLVDFVSGINRLSPEDKVKYEGRYDEAPGIFALMDPMPHAIESFKRLASVFDVYILSTSPWLNPLAAMNKVEWVQKHFGWEPGSAAYKRLILSHHKNLNHGDYLIDDRVHDFVGEHIHFGSDRFPDWPAVTAYLLD
jgi:5'(3')-deoxyribonucleotidase